MFVRLFLGAARCIASLASGCIQAIQAARERYRGRIETREMRGLKLLREWLSPEQRAQFDAKRYFDVVGCDSGKRYRIHYGTTTNIHELGDDDRPLMGWCFLPECPLVAGDVMLAQKIALETHEYGALTVANRFPTGFSRGNHR